MSIWNVNTKMGFPLESTRIFARIMKLTTLCVKLHNLMIDHSLAEEEIEEMLPEARLLELIESGELDNGNVVVHEDVWIEQWY